jgi:hypothetical protein
MPELETICEQLWKRQRLHVPRVDGALISRPMPAAANELIHNNQSLLSRCLTDIQGRTLKQMRVWSREKVMEAARTYTSELIGTSIAAEPFHSVVVGGHQPSLFHPGVWVKNFAISNLAAQTDGVALNLVIDNDILSASHIRVPGGDRDHPVNETIPFDEGRPAQPWEEIEIQNREVFESFGNRVVRKMNRWNIKPLAASIWPDAVNQLEQSTLLRDSLTAARHRLERRWGLANLELPISRLCTLDPFLWFASHLLAHLPEFHRVHNNVLQQYRQIYHIRSQTHPVPELKTADGWLEAPFWIWRKSDHKRENLFVKQVDREVHLSDGNETFARLPLSPDMEACCAVEALRELPQQGIRLRTRALTTTLFSRLCLSDLFVHGIGGAKYDEMTDRIIAQFYKMPAPEFLTLSATLLLPLAEPFPVTAIDVSRLENLQRDFRYNSDRHLPNDIDSEVVNLVSTKKNLISEQRASRTNGLSHSERRLRSRANYERYHRFQEINRKLSTFTFDQRRATGVKLTSVHQQLAANAVLKDREYSFCLFPEDKLRPYMTGLSWQVTSGE